MLLVHCNGRSKLRPCICTGLGTLICGKYEFTDCSRANSYLPPLLHLWFGSRGRNRTFGLRLDNRVGSRVWCPISALFWQMWDSATLPARQGLRRSVDRSSLSHRSCKALLSHPFVWHGHSCPRPLTLIFDLQLRWHGSVHRVRTPLLNPPGAPHLVLFEMWDSTAAPFTSLH